MDEFDLALRRQKADVEFRMKRRMSTGNMAYQRRLSSINLASISHMVGVPEDEAAEGLGLGFGSALGFGFDSATQQQRSGGTGGTGGGGGRRRAHSAPDHNSNTRRLSRPRSPGTDFAAREY